MSHSPDHERCECCRGLGSQKAWPSGLMRCCVCNGTGRQKLSCTRCFSRNWSTRFTEPNGPGYCDICLTQDEIDFMKAAARAMTGVGEGAG
jgi:hypothetical protein